MSEVAEKVKKIIAEHLGIDDMEKITPMDRLVCGDVGFGKTEVAMRASFIVASNNYDYETFVEDFTELNFFLYHFQNFIYSRLNYLLKHFLRYLH